MNVFKNSRYATQDFFEVQSTGEQFAGTYTPVSIAPAQDDRYVTPRPNEILRPDKLAFRVYGQLGVKASRLWWIICDLNGIVNPLAPLDPTVGLRCPHPDRVLLEILD